jgi:hypothetical protein
MSHDFKPEPHEKAMIDVMLKGKNSSLRKAYEIATKRSEEVVNSLIKGRRK